MSFCPRPPAGFGSGSVQEQRERWDRKRSRTSRELVQSEQDYCQRLQLVCTFFVEILKAKGTLKQHLREAIFSCITAIHSANQSLLVHLENGFFGKGLDQFCSQLHLYNTYVDNFYHARKVLEVQLKKSRAFRRFKKLQESRPELNGLSLEDLLQLPVQRIQQYQQLLEDLAANSRPDDSQFQQISGALSAVTEVWHRFQDNQRRHENELQLRRVQKLLMGKETKVLAAGRWFIREGWLQVVPQKGTEARPRMFFLFSDVLLQARRCSPLHPSHPDRLRGEQAFPLRDCTLDRVFGRTRGSGGLLSLSFPKAQLLLMSRDPQDLRDWQDKLEAAIRKLQSRQTEVNQRDDLSRGPLTSVPDNHNLPRSHQDRKRTTVSAESSEHAQKACSAPKRMKPCDAAQHSSPEEGSSSCVLL